MRASVIEGGLYQCTPSCTAISLVINIMYDTYLPTYLPTGSQLQAMIMNALTEICSCRTSRVHMLTNGSGSG